MADVDAKAIGLTVKDIVLGVAGLAAGASLGTAGAEAVSKIGSGLDKALIMGGVMEDEKKPATRAENFDRAGKPPPPKVLAASSESSAPQDGGTPSNPPVEGGPLEGDSRLTVDQLRDLGWSRQQIHQILAGPDSTDLGSLTRRQVGGRRALGVEGKRIAQVGGKSTPAMPGKRVREASGSALPTVGGRRSSPNDDEDGSA